MEWSLEKPSKWLVTELFRVIITKIETHTWCVMIPSLIFKTMRGTRISPDLRIDMNRHERYTDSSSPKSDFSVGLNGKSHSAKWDKTGAKQTNALVGNFRPGVGAWETVVPGCSSDVDSGSDWLWGRGKRQLRRYNRWQAQRKQCWEMPHWGRLSKPKVSEHDASAQV